MKSNLQIAKDYLLALERGVERDVLAAFYSPDVVQEAYPNQLVEAGARRGLEALLDANARNDLIMRDQRYQLRNAIASGDTVVLEVDWAGTLVANASEGSVGAAGETLRAHFAVFLDFRGGRIVRQRSYECYLAR